MRRKGWIILSVILVACIALSIMNGQRTKESYINNVELKDYLSKKDLRVQYIPYFSDTQFREDLPDIETIHRFQDVEATSDIVVKARLKDNFDRKMYHDCILSQAEILEVYRGDLKKNDSIYVFEHAGYFDDDIVLSLDGYNMMQESEEYILFLKRLKNSHFGEEGKKYVYVPSTTTFSKYKCSDDNIRLFSDMELGDTDDFSKSKLVLYSEVRNEEVFLYADKFNQYVDFKRQVMKKYNVLDISSIY